MGNLITEDEYVILKNIPKHYKWIAREYSSLELFSIKPKKIHGTWGYEGRHGFLSVFDHLFQFIKWEDKEPHEIAQLISAYETMMNNSYL